MPDLETNLAAARARLAAREAEAADAERRYVSELPEADDRRGAILRTKVEDAARSLATERDRVTAIANAIAERDAEAARQEREARWREFQAIAERRAELGSEAEATIALLGKIMGEIEAATVQMKAVSPTTISVGDDEAFGHLGMHDGIANSLIRSGMGWLFPNAPRFLEPTRKGIAARMVPPSRNWEAA